MAKKKSKKGDSKKADVTGGKAQAKAEAQQQRAAEAAAEKERARSDGLVAEAKKARKAADKAGRAAEKAESKAAVAAQAAGRPVKTKPDELGLAKLALRAAEAKLTDVEHRLGQVQQQLDDERRLQDEAVQVVLEDAVVDAAVRSTVEEVVLDVVLDAESAGDAVEAADADVVEAFVVEAAVLEAVAVELEATAEATGLPDEEPSHDGEAQDAAQAFVEAGPVDEPTSVATEAAPPLPTAPADDEPSEQWTLLRLREEAKRRGLTGTSNLPKAALLGRLRSS